MKENAADYLKRIATEMDAIDENYTLDLDGAEEIIEKARKKCFNCEDIQSCLLGKFVKAILRVVDIIDANDVKIMSAAMIVKGANGSFSENDMRLSILLSDVLFT